MVKVLFDTSILIASVLPEHPYHALALEWVQQVQRHEIEGVLSTHTIAELYSVLKTQPTASPPSKSSCHVPVSNPLPSFS